MLQAKGHEVVKAGCQTVHCLLWKGDGHDVSNLLGLSWGAQEESAAAKKAGPERIGCVPPEGEAKSACRAVHDNVAQATEGPVVLPP